jgi:hypothetical protein
MGTKLIAFIAAATLALWPAPDRPALAQCALPVPESPSPGQVQAAMSQARDHGFLWRVRKEGRTSYVYGTMHVGRLEWMFPGPAVGLALRDADVLALELDPFDPQMQSRLAAAIAAMPHETIPEALEQRLRSAAESLCVPYESIAALAPEFQIVTLDAFAGRPYQLEARFGTDLGLAAVARAAGKEIVSMETPESQVQALALRDPGLTQAFVEASLEELEPGRSAEHLIRISRAWAGSDYEDLAHYADWCLCLDTEIERLMMKRLLDERNPSLAETVDRLHQSGKRVFAAVGSLHMFGPTGLPQLLEKRGYRVERVELARHTQEGSAP